MGYRLTRPRPRALSVIALLALLAATTPVPIAAQEAPPTDPASLSRAINDNAVHLSLALQGGLQWGTIQYLDYDILWQQGRFETAARIDWWPAEPWKLSHGIYFHSSGDSSLETGLAKPGMWGWGADLGLGWFPKPPWPATFHPGVEVRQSISFNAITLTELWAFWPRTTLRPFARVLSSHTEIALPLSVSWRRDPGPVVELSLEIAGVL